MKEKLVHVYAMAVALCILFEIVTGSVVTNSLAVPQAPMGSGLFSSQSHQHTGEAVGLLAVILGIWAFLAVKRSAVRWLAWLPLAVAAGEIGLGHAAGKATPMVSLFHGFLAPVLLATVVALALATSKSWGREPVMIEDKGWPPLRGLAKTTLVFVVLQVALGAAFRHGELGVMPHIVGALIVVVLLLTFVICLTQMPGQGLLKPAAITLLVVAGVQVFLGLTVVSMSDKALANLAGLIFTTAHVVLGSVTLAASAVIEMEAVRCVRPKA